MKWIQKALFPFYKRIESQTHELQYLFLELTRQCNLNCRHCGSDCSQEVRGQELGFDQWVQVLDYIQSHWGSEVFLVLTGGEPFCVTYLERLALEIKRRALRFGMVTNGVLLTKEKIEYLIECGLESMTLSVDGPPGVHEWLRGKETWTGLDKALGILGSSKLMYRDAVTSVHPGNLKLLDETAKILLQNGINHWRLFRIFPLGRAAGNKELTLSGEETSFLLDWIEKARKDPQYLGLNISYSCEGWMNWNRDSKVRDLPFLCRSGINMASILADGTLSGCSNNASRFYQGNFFKDDFKTVWENGYKAMRDRTWARAGKCGQCDNWRKCQGSSIHLWQDGREDIGFCYEDKCQ